MPVRGIRETEEELATEWRALVVRRLGLIGVFSKFEDEVTLFVKLIFRGSTIAFSVTPPFVTIYGKTVLMLPDVSPVFLN